MPKIKEKEVKLVLFLERKLVVLKLKRRVGLKSRLRKRPTM
jgi:hypothetical protein